MRCCLSFPEVGDLAAAAAAGRTSVGQKQACPRRLNGLTQGLCDKGARALPAAAAGKGGVRTGAAGLWQRYRKAAKFCSAADLPAKNDVSFIFPQAPFVQHIKIAGRHIGPQLHNSDRNALTYRSFRAVVSSAHSCQTRGC